MIEEAGWSAVEAVDSAEALAALSCDPHVDVLFTDINMPGAMDGLQLPEYVHQTHPNIALVITSGKQTVSDNELPDDGSFLPKPYVYSQFVGLIGRKLQS